MLQRIVYDVTQMREISKLPKKVHSLFVNEQQNGDASALVSEEVRAVSAMINSRNIM